MASNDNYWDKMYETSATRGFGQSQADVDASIKESMETTSMERFFSENIEMILLIVFVLTLIFIIRKRVMLIGTRF